MATNSTTPGSTAGGAPLAGAPTGLATPTGNLPGVPGTTDPLNSNLSAEEVKEKALEPVDAVPVSASPESIAVLLEQQRLTAATAVEKSPEYQSIRVQPQETPLGATVGQPGVAEAAKRTGSKAFQFPSAPTRFEFTKSKRVVIIPDGVYRTDDADEIAELEATVQAGGIYPYTGDIISPFQIPPKPVNPNEPN